MTLLHMSNTHVNSYNPSNVIIYTYVAGAHMMSCTIRLYVAQAILNCVGYLDINIPVFHVTVYSYRRSIK